MQKLALIAVLLLALTGGLGAEGEEKPAIAPPEPKRQASPAKPFVLTALTYQQNRTSDPGLIELVKFFRKSTTIKMPVECNSLYLSDRRLAETSLLYMTQASLDLDVQLNESEKTALGEFLKRGGLLYAEESTGVGVAGTPFDQMLKALIKDPLVLGSQGAQWAIIPNEHPLFASYFQFPSGPPLVGAEGGNVEHLEMVELRGRVAAIFSELNLSRFWWDVEAQSRELGLRFGANLIVLAMTQRAVVGAVPGRSP
jgi:hypothetical protein